MSTRLVEFSGNGEPVISDGVMSVRPLEWYTVVGIELVLFVGTVVPLVYGALLAR